MREGARHAPLHARATSRPVRYIARPASQQRTYSTYGRGLDILISTYNYLDLTPLGRNEKDLPYTMSWLRHHDRYPDSA
ncbi:MAG: DUF899 family protein [Myxococcales bacterium]